MGKKILLTFADSRLSKTLLRLRREAKAMKTFDKILIHSESDLDATFRARFADVLRPGIRGFGYWVWKPEQVLRTLETMSEGDVLLYVDAGCRLIPTGRKRLLEYFDMTEASSTGRVGVTIPGHAIGEWTKGDLLDYFAIRDREEILRSDALASGTFLVRKNEDNVALIRKWLTVYEKDFSLITDAPSRSPNLPGFREHRHDQSAFSILMRLHGCTLIDGSECYPPGRKPSGSPDWSTMDRSKPVWHYRDKAFRYPPRWHLLRFASRLMPLRRWRQALRDHYRAIEPV